MKFDDFTHAYISAALWSTNDEADEADEALEKNYGPDDLSPELLAQVLSDCEEFQTDHSHLWGDCKTSRYWSIDEQAGHDFWLTRNGHGVGFWDRPEIYGKENANKLTGASKAYGEQDWYAVKEKVYGL